MGILEGGYEKEILNRAANGDEAAFRIIFDQYRDKIYVFSRYLTRSEFLAEEIVQEVFLKLWHYRKNLLGVEFLAPYLKTIARNVYNRYLDRLAHEKIVLKNIIQNSSGMVNTTEYDVDGKQMQQALLKAIHGLSPQQKKVYLMHNQQSLSYAEIASELNLSIFTIKEHMQKALANIRANVRSNMDIPAVLALILLLKN